MSYSDVESQIMSRGGVYDVGFAVELEQNNKESGDGPTKEDKWQYHNVQLSYILCPSDGVIQFPVSPQASSQTYFQWSGLIPNGVVNAN